MPASQRNVKLGYVKTGGGVEIFIKTNGRLKLETPNYGYITRRHLRIARPRTGSLSSGDWTSERSDLSVLTEYYTRIVGWPVRIQLWHHKRREYYHFLLLDDFITRKTARCDYVSNRASPRDYICAIYVSYRWENAGEGSWVMRRENWLYKNIYTFVWRARVYDRRILFADK